MAPWNFAILVDAIAHATPERIAVVHGDRRVSWQLLASRSRSLAWHLATDAGLRAGDRVAVVLPNCPEYLEVFLAARKLRAAPLGVGVTAGVDELHAVIDRSDARVVVCADATADAVRAAVRRIPKRWRPKIVEIGEPYEAAIAAATPPVDWELEIPTADDLIAIAELDASANRESPDTAVLAVGPFAVGDSFGELLGVLGRKGRAVFLDPPTFDADRVWDTVEREHVVKLVIDGDVQARPLLAALSPGDAAGLTALTTIASAGAPMSSDVAAALATVLPRRDAARRQRGPRSGRRRRHHPERWTRPTSSTGCGSTPASSTASSSASPIPGSESWWSPSSRSSSTTISMPRNSRPGAARTSRRR